MAVAVNKWKYRLSYGTYFGGVTALSKDQFVKANGFANSFYGWGGEDDDLYHRVVQLQKFGVFRYPGNVGRFSMLKHEKVRSNLVGKLKSDFKIFRKLLMKTWTK